MTTPLNAQHIVVAGLGITGQACVRFLLAQQASVKVWDTRDNAVIPADITVPVTLGKLPADYWQGVDMLVLSPGIALSVPAIADARDAGVEVIGEIELFARMNTTPALGITGSNGKTTVTLLVTHILQQAGKRVCAAGNVGTPALDTLSQHLDVVVLELSSFQLETTSSLSLKGACILNISDDHLDRHGTMASYTEAKQRIFAHASAAAVWRAQPETYPHNGSLPQVFYDIDASEQDFGLAHGWVTFNGEPVVDLSRVKLVGQHNVLNIQAALALANMAGVTPSQAAEAVYSFESAPHRCVEIARHDDVQWIDDSKATNVGATLAAIEGIGPQCHGQLILIAGGDGKGADLSALKSALLQYVSHVIGLGRDGQTICDLVPSSQYVNSMFDAVVAAHAIAEPGDVVLLSPACASLDMFNNYVHRGEVFANAVQEVAA